MRNSAVYSGRIIIDHLPKTAGTALNAWLRAELGECSVSHSLIGTQHELIKKYGGEHSIISGHIDFNGDGLDPRYQYITAIREPVDRVTSFLFFVLKNHTSEDLPGLHSWCENFINSEGDICEEELLLSVSNVYTRHFCGIKSNHYPAEDSANVDKALSAVANYDVVGFFEDMPRLLEEVACLIGIPAPTEIARINPTVTRPKSSQISEKLKNRITEINRMDIEFYDRLKLWKESQQGLRAPVTVALWEKYESPHQPAVSTPILPQAFAQIREGNAIIHGQILTIDIDFLLNRLITNLYVGLAIYDSNFTKVFGTTSIIQRKEFSEITAGSHRITTHLIADLPKGRYTIGFIFKEQSTGSTTLLGRYDSLCEFSVNYPLDLWFEGFINLPSEMNLHRTLLADNRLIVVNPVGKISVASPLQSLQANEYCSLRVEAQNSGAKKWVGDIFRPVNLSYIWYTSEGSVLPKEGLRCRLPEGGIEAGSCVVMEMQIQAPPDPGSYTLEINLVQEFVSWFGEPGFTPWKGVVEVISSKTLDTQ